MYSLITFIFSPSEYVVCYRDLVISLSGKRVSLENEGFRMSGGINERRRWNLIRECSEF